MQLKVRSSGRERPLRSSPGRSSLRLRQGHQDRSMNRYERFGKVNGVAANLTPENQCVQEFQNRLPEHLAAERNREFGVFAFGLVGVCNLLLEPVQNVALFEEGH